MIRRFTLSLLVLLTYGVLTVPGITCTSFFLDKGGRRIFGKNYDWHIGTGQLIANPRGLSKTAMPDRANESSLATWKSRYGSLTFNQYGREMPSGGVNEAGLVVELMMLGETRYPESDNRRGIKDLQWIQYQLDTAATVQQVIASDTHLRIFHHEKPGLHFLTADKTGDCAVIEFLNGRLVARTQDSLTVKALANHTYDESRAFLRMHQGFGGVLPILTGTSSPSRFIRAAKMLQEYDGQSQGTALEFAFSILDSVSQPSTQWRIIYDLDKMRVYFRTRSNPDTRYADLAHFNFSCAAPVRVLNLAAKGSGNMIHWFNTYSSRVNRELIRQALKSTPFTKDIPESSMQQRSHYPETLRCEDGSR